MKDFNNVTVMIEIEEDIALAILLNKDGTINRKGDGTSTIDTTIFIGMTDTSTMFSELQELITEEFEAFLNKSYDIPNKKGKTCSLEIVLSNESKATGMKFFYGIDSMGPPPAIRSFILKILEVTNPWFKEQINMVKKNSKKKWWHWWKKGTT